MKYIDADLLRKEIERRHTYQKEMYNKTKPDGRPNDGWAESLAIMGELEELRTFLDTLPEQPEPKPMNIPSAGGARGTTSPKFKLDVKPEQPVIKKSNALFDECVKNCDPAIMKEVSDNIDKMLGRQPVEGLEEAAEKSASQYYVDGGYSPFLNVETAAHEAGFIAGAEWQKKRDDLETADLLAIAHLQGMEQQKSEIPRWHKVKQNGMLDKPTQFLLSAKEGYFFCNGDCISRDGYAIFVDELEKLPKEDEK